MALVRSAARKAEAEQAFSDLVAAGVDAGSLSVKLLFKVGGTAFVDSADLSTISVTEPVASVLVNDLLGA